MGLKYSKVRKDANHKEIVDSIRVIGGEVVDIASVKNAFDILVIYKGEIYCVEIKDGKKKLSERRLTDGEVKCRNRIEKVGGKYWVVESVAQMFRIFKGEESYEVNRKEFHREPLDEWDEYQKSKKKNV